MALTVFIVPQDSRIRKIPQVRYFHKITWCTTRAGSLEYRQYTAIQKAMLPGEPGLRQEMGFKDCRSARFRKRDQKDQRDRSNQCRHPQVEPVLEGQPSGGRPRRSDVCPREGPM